MSEHACGGSLCYRTCDQFHLGRNSVLVKWKYSCGGFTTTESREVNLGGSSPEATTLGFTTTESREVNLGGSSPEATTLGFTTTESREVNLGACFFPFAS
jgi:hypothetical protein